MDEGLSSFDKTKLNVIGDEEFATDFGSTLSTSYVDPSTVERYQQRNKVG